jgi:hypothetical protein
MLACGHERRPFGERVCPHLRSCRVPWISYVKWLIGAGLEAELLCVPCAEDREKGLPVRVAFVCEECFQYATTEVGDLVGVRGKPGISTRPEPFNSALQKTPLPKEVGKIVDICPVNRDGRSVWLMLAEGGVIIRLDADTADWARVASVNVPPEPDHKPWAGHVLRRRLHASSDGAFAAVVNDYGRYGRLVDLGSGDVTLALDGGGYHQGTVPFSFAFANVHGRPVAIHRTDWNRLDVTNPSTGQPLTDRGPTSFRRGEQRPEHYLDYFHGALYVSPNCEHIVDDGWVWHPVGVPTAWRLDRWLSDNAWESEDGPTKKDLCARDYCWDHAMTWIDERRVAVGGIGDDDTAMVDGARIFDITLPGSPGGQWRSDLHWARELKVFPGPAGVFFSDGVWLFSSDDTGLSRWDLADGTRTGQLQNFRPTHHHRDAHELVQLTDGFLIRWRTS